MTAGMTAMSENQIAEVLIGALVAFLVVSGLLLGLIYLAMRRRP